MYILLHNRVLVSPTILYSAAIIFFIKKILMLGIVRFCLLFFVVISNSYAQKDSVIVLNEVVLSTTLKMDIGNIGSMIEKISANTLQAYKAKNLGNIVSSETGVYMKNYGITGVASNSMRGTSTQHTLLLWNGLPIENLTLGGAAFNLMANNFADEVLIQSGGSSALWGSSAIGGVIHCNTIEKKDSGFHVQTNSVGASFGSFFQNVQVQIVKPKWQTQWQVFYKEAKNNFPFYNISKRNNPLDTIENNKLIQYGILQENYFYLNPKRKIITRFWYQNSDRQLQASMLGEGGESTFRDEAIRTSLEFYDHSKTTFQYQLKVAYIKDNFVYDNLSTLLHSPVLTHRLIVESDARYQINKNQQFNLGIYYTYNQAATINYFQTVALQKIAAFAAYSFNVNNKLALFNISIRQEHQNNISSFTGKIAAEWKAFPYHQILFNVSKNFRYPTLNDLYWQPGGNKNLLPENAYGQEIILKGTCQNKTHLFQWNFVAYHNYVFNWIQWSPINQGIWSPQNLAEVRAWGIEKKIEYEFKIKYLSIKNQARFFYTSSTNNKTDETNKTAFKKQLRYVPAIKTVASCNVQWHKTSVRFAYQFVGERFANDDNTNALPAYKLVDIYFSQNFIILKTNLIFSFQVDNLLNETYHTMAYYAQPLRNYSIGINASF